MPLLTARRWIWLGYDQHFSAGGDQSMSRISGQRYWTYVLLKALLLSRSLLCTAGFLGHGEIRLCLMRVL